MLAADDYAHHVAERLLLRINEEFVAASAHKAGTRIRLHAVFRDTEIREPKLSTSAALRVASKCWLSLRYAVRMIDAIKIRESMQQNWLNSDFAERLIGCTEQLIKSNKMLFFSGLSSFSLTCVLSINQQNHLCITLDNGDRLIASPVDKMLTCLDDKVNSRLYMKATDVKSPKNGPPADHQLTFFVSALGETVQKRHPGKPVVEKYVKQRIFIKSSIKKKITETVFGKQS